MLKVRKAALAKSVQDLKEMIVVAERADPNIRRQKMFGGDNEKEKAFNQNLS